MNASERRLILSFGTQGMSRAEFLKQFRQSSDGASLTRVLLDEALASREPDDVECALSVGFMFGFTDAHLTSLLEFVPVHWHRRHEDVVTALGQLESSKAVDALYHATQWVPAYLDFDESRALAVKAIWALGSIEGADAEQALETLARSGERVLSEAATKQLKRRSESLGVTHG